MDESIGLLRVLAPDIFTFIGATFLIVAAARIARAVIRTGGAINGLDHTVIVERRRTVAASARWVWYTIVVVILWHAFSVTWSLRIPRSDVNATGVYQQMDRLIQGNPQ